jgi:hypothetical protein
MEDRLVDRNECRALGLNVCNTQFQRYEKQGLLTPHKAGGVRSARVRYWLSEVMTLLGLRLPSTQATLRA